MTACVVAHPNQNVGVRFDSAQERVARRTERAANSARSVVVIHEEIASDTADQAPARLRRFEVIDLLRRQAVLALVSGAQILGLRGVGILLTPFTQALVTPLPVRDPIRAVSSTRTLTAFTSPLPPIGEGGLGKVAGAGAAVDHASTMPRNTDMQPCHADVLLELANGDPA